MDDFATRIEVAIKADLGSLFSITSSSVECVKARNKRRKRRSVENFRAQITLTVKNVAQKHTQVDSFLFICTELEDFVIKKIRDDETLSKLLKTEGAFDVDVDVDQPKLLNQLINSLNSQSLSQPELATNSDMVDLTKQVQVNPFEQNLYKFNRENNLFNRPLSLNFGFNFGHCHVET